MVLKTILVLVFGVLAGVLGVVLSDSLTSEPEIQDPASVLSEQADLHAGYLVFYDSNNNSNILVQCTYSSRDPRYIETMNALGYGLISNGC